MVIIYICVYSSYGKLGELTCLVKVNSGAFAWLTRFVCAGVKTINRTLVQNKQPDQDRLNRRVLVYFQVNSGVVSLWCESKQTNPKASAIADIAEQKYLDPLLK